MDSISGLTVKDVIVAACHAPKNAVTAIEKSRNGFIARSF